MIAKKWVWPTFGCKLGQNDPIVMQLKLDMSCHLLNVYTKFQIDISKHVEEKSGKRGRTDGQTLPRHNTSRFSNGRIKKTSHIYILWTKSVTNSYIFPEESGQMVLQRSFGGMKEWISQGHTNGTLCHTSCPTNPNLEPRQGSSSWDPLQEEILNLWSKSWKK